MTSRPAARRLATVVSAAICAVSVTAAGCVMSDEVGGSNKPSPTTMPLAPVPGALGSPVQHGGVSLDVLAIGSFDRSPEQVPRIKVTLRTENTSTAARRNPALELHCQESQLLGVWFAGSTWEPGYLLPVNEVNAGEVMLGFPPKPENPQYPVAGCTNATLVAIMGDPVGDRKLRVVYPIPASVITESLQRPVGPNLPLPDAPS